MRTITINYYLFNELSEQAQRRAIEQYRDAGHDFAWQSENAATVKAIAECMDCDFDWYSYDGISCRVSLTSRHDCEDLSGRRAWAYIENNYISRAEQPKTYWKDRVIHCDGRKNWTRKSKIWFTIDDCPFTGYCADCCFSEAWKEWKQNFNTYSTVGDFIELVADKLSEEWTNDNEWQNSDEYIADLLTDNEYEFTEDGEIA